MNTSKNTGCYKLLGALFLSLCSVGVFAETSIAILDFELNDLTIIPRTPAEIQRTSSIKAMLEGELKRAGYKIIFIDSNIQRENNGGFGYLFDHSEIAAELAEKAGADYILVGRLHKPSFLFAYIMGHLVRANDGQLIGHYISESKGGDKKLTLKGVESLAVKIDSDLDNIYIPPPPQSRTVHRSQ